VAGHAKESGEIEEDRRSADPAGRVAIEVAAQHRALLAKLRAELGDISATRFAEIAERLAEDFGRVTASAVEGIRGGAWDGPGGEEAGLVGAPREELPSLYRPGHLRRRLDQLIETNRRYGHPFGLAIFDVAGPATLDGVDNEMALALVGAALRDSIRIVDEAFQLEEDAICVLAPNLDTVEGVKMAERLLGKLDELERAGGLRIALAAGVVACPDHGAEADALLHKADAALWRARAVGQPLGVGALAS